jgi:Fic family protein
MAAKKARPPYGHPSQMEPMMPTTRPELNALALDLVRGSAELGGKLHPITRRSLAFLLRNMNSYYSNLIEGHRTHPRDIERAIKNDLSHNKAQRLLQLEAKAHVEVQELMERRLVEKPNQNICSREFLCWLHREFYTRVPEELLTVEDSRRGTIKVVPGDLRTHDVEVGHHLPPRWETVPEFLKRFEAAYSPGKLEGAQKIIAAAASHHRLAWIHPFLDGNGRVTRLFTHAFLISAGVDAHGLWTIARGMARNREQYMSSLETADIHRQGDLDGRGNLSDSGLRQFCHFFLETAVDQTSFMRGLLDWDSLESNVKFYAAQKKLRDEVVRLLVDLFFRGEMSRGDAAKILSLKEVRARFYIKELLNEGVLVSTSPKGPLRLAFPTNVAEIFFPKLFPAGT